MTVILQFITGVMVGIEFVDDDFGNQFLAIDMFIVRFLIGKSNVL